MTEIERIIDNNTEKWHRLHNGKAVYQIKTSRQKLAKAIEQYVIKARIEELKQCNESVLHLDRYDKYRCKVLDTNSQRIAQLKKELGEE